MAFMPRGEPRSVPDPLSEAWDRAAALNRRLVARNEHAGPRFTTLENRLRDAEMDNADWQGLRGLQLSGAGRLPEERLEALQPISVAFNRHDADVPRPTGPRGPEIVGRSIVGGINALGDTLRSVWGVKEALPPLMRNRGDMVEADWIGSDKYFHCKGNCEAAQRGPGAARAAERLSNGREIYGVAKGDPQSDKLADQDANRFGRDQGAANPKSQCSALCAQYRPKGLPSEY